ncbi:hypothetical protein PISMIDRAFT_80513, partial [Pisolithus microcarpus 441]
IVVICSGHDWVPQCMMMHETLYIIAENVQNFAAKYSVDIIVVPNFNKVRSL